MLVAVATVLAATLALQGQHTRDAESPAAEAPPSATGKAPESAATRSAPRRAVAHLREGTEIRDVAGRLQLLDGRFEFVSGDGRFRLRILENLALERAARKSGEGLQAIQWQVSGVVTEYENANYLLVRRIVVDGGE